MTLRATLLVSIAACFFACADHKSSQETDGGLVQSEADGGLVLPEIDEPDAGRPRAIELPEDPKPDGRERGTIDKPDSGLPVVPPPVPLPVDPCEGASEGFVCNGYSFAVTPLLGNGDIELGNGYADETYERFVPEKLIRKACVQIVENEEGELRRGWPRTVTAVSGANLWPESISTQLSIVGFRDTPPDLAAYAEHARESATVSTHAYAQWEQGPFRTYFLSGPVPESPEGCGPAWVYSVSTAAAVGIIVELTFPSVSSRDRFVAAIDGANGVSVGMTGSGELSARVNAEVAKSGAHVKFHVAISTGIADEMNALLKSSACSALNFAACRQTYDSVLKLFASHLKEDSNIWETRKPGMRTFW